jgi:hypothetical protein
VLPQLIPWPIQHMLAATPITGKRWVLTNGVSLLHTIQHY